MISLALRPQTPLAELTALPRPIARLKGPNKRREKRRGGKRKREKGKEMAGKGRGKEGR